MLYFKVVAINFMEVSFKIIMVIVKDVLTHHVVIFWVPPSLLVRFNPFSFVLLPSNC